MHLFYVYRGLLFTCLQYGFRRTDRNTYKLHGKDKTYSLIITYSFKSPLVPEIVNTTTITRPSFFQRYFQSTSPSPGVYRYTALTRVHYLRLVKPGFNTRAVFISSSVDEKKVSTTMMCATGRYSLFSFEEQLCTLSWVLSLLGRYFYNMYIVKMFEIVFCLNVKDTNICPCLHNIRLSYNI